MTVSVHLSYILGDMPFEKRFVTARELGFDGVEFPFPFATPADEYRRLLDDNGLAQITLGAPTSDYRAGEPGYSVTPSLRSEFDDSISVAIDYAKAIDCRRVHVFSGPLAPDVSRQTAFETYCENLARASDRLAAEGLSAVVEPVNSTDFAGYFIDTLAMVLKVITHIGKPGIGVILDVYHAAVNGEDVSAFLHDHRDLVSHIQLADFPGRHEPGEGKSDFARLFQVLAETRYEGSIGLEYVPTRSILDGVPLANLLGISAGSSPRPAYHRASWA